MWLLQLDLGFRTQRVLFVLLAPSAAVIGLSSSVPASFDDDFESLAATNNKHSAAADHVEFFPVVFAAVLREVHIAS